jgi:hypothetical protein
MLAAVGLAALTTGIACSSPVEPRNGMRFTPPSWYRALYAHDVQCSRRARPFEELTWYWVPGTDFTYDGHVDVGLTNGEAGRIYLSEAYIANPLVIRHEMLHALLRNEGGHPPVYFEVHCPLMWSNYYTVPDTVAEFVDDSIMLEYEQTHGGSLDLPGASSARRVAAGKMRDGER